MTSRSGLLHLGVLIVACATAAGSTAPPDAPAPCSQEIVERADRWREAGGPGAFLLVCPGTFEPGYAYKVMVRFEDGLQPPFAIEARLRGTDLRANARVAYPIARGEWAEGHGPPADLRGSVLLVIITFPRSGCWEVALSSGSDEVGMALVDVPAGMPVTGSLPPT